MWDLLDDDPSAVRRIVRVAQLAETDTETPQEMVGALDLIEAMARAPGTGTALKEWFAKRTLHAAQSAPPEASLETLGLLQDRLERPSFATLPRTLGEALRSAVAAQIRKAPLATIPQAIARLAEAMTERPWYNDGLVEGLRWLSREQPRDLAPLWRDPLAAKQILAAAPDLAVTLMPMLVAQADESAVADWLAGVDDSALRRAIREALLPTSKFSSVQLVTELLRGLEADETLMALDALWKSTDEMQVVGVESLVTTQIAREYPSATRSWAAGLAEWRPVTARIVAATFMPNREGCLQLLESAEIPEGPRRAETLAFFMRSLGPGHYPTWLRELACSTPEILTTLLTAGNAGFPQAAEEAQRLLERTPELPVGRWPEALPLVEGAKEKPYFERLVDTTMRSLLDHYLGGALAETDFQGLQSRWFAVEWLRSADPHELSGLLAPPHTSPDRWLNAWRWLATAPDVLYAPGGVAVDHQVSALLRSLPWTWRKEASECWVDVLVRARMSGSDSRARLRLCVQALQFAFANWELPLGPVVREAFCEVYSAVTTSQILPPETAPLFGILDWDKGKELRRELIDAFLRSSWPPGELVLATGGGDLLHRVLKRLTRKAGGRIYAEKALSDLEGRPSTPRTDSALAELRALLSDPDYSNDSWY